MAKNFCHCKMTQSEEIREISAAGQGFCRASAVDQFPAPKQQRGGSQICRLFCACGRRQCISSPRAASLQKSLFHLLSACYCLYVRNFVLDKYQYFKLNQNSHQHVLKQAVLCKFYVINYSLKFCNIFHSSSEHLLLKFSLAMSVCLRPPGNQLSLCVVVQLNKFVVVESMKG